LKLFFFLVQFRIRGMALLFIVTAGPSK